MRFVMVFNDYKLDDGYYNLGSWIEKAAKLHNK